MARATVNVEINLEPQFVLSDRLQSLLISLGWTPPAQPAESDSAASASGDTGDARSGLSGEMGAVSDPTGSNAPPTQEA